MTGGRQKTTRPLSQEQSAVEPIFEIGEPWSGAEVAANLSSLAGEITDYFDDLSDEELFAPQGPHWSPADHLRHLSKSVRAVARGMRQPKPLLVVFGLARTSRRFAEIRELYRRQLAAGGQAGRYAPSADTPGRELVMARWHSTSDELERTVGIWSESALDRYRLPHPLLGKLTVREMLFFTLYHNAHHARRVRERRG